MEALCKAHRDKVSHKNRRVAQAMLRLLKGWKKNYDGHVYHCGDCNGYHVGRPDMRMHKRKIKRANARVLNETR